MMVPCCRRSVIPTQTCPDRFKADFLLLRGWFHRHLATAARAFLSTGSHRGTHGHDFKVDSGVDVAIMGRPACWTRPLARGQWQIGQLVPARRANLAAREEPVRHLDQATAHCCLVLQLPPQFGETRIGNRSRQTSVAHHASHVQVLNADGVKPACEVGRKAMQGV
jgi:hypothetical protein